MWHDPKVLEFVCSFHLMQSKKVLEWSCSKLLEGLVQTSQLSFLIRLTTESEDIVN